MKRTGISRRPLRWTKGLAILLTLGIVGWNLSAWAGGFKPRKGMGKPARRVGLATRGGCGVSSTSPKLTALVPVGNNGLTMNAYPTFHWFMPQNTYESAQFRLIRISDADQSAEVIYSTVVDHSTSDQIQGFTLPAQDVAPLDEGVDYRWDISLVCDPEEPSGNLLAQGWVRYEAPNSALTQTLQQATPEQSYQLFASNGYWYETVQHLQLQMKQTTNSQWTEQWKSLMQQEEVELGHLITPMISDNTLRTLP